jgi:hypothetical protein
MKKKFKKLALNTETLRKMDSGDLGHVAGATAADTNCTIAGSVCTVACSVCMNCSNVPSCPNTTC